jgi:hypothetical protein
MKHSYWTVRIQKLQNSEASDLTQLLDCKNSEASDETQLLDCQNSEASDETQLSPNAIQQLSNF